MKENLTEGRAPSTVSQLQAVLKELAESHNDERLSQLADRALHLLEGLPSFDCGQKEQKAAALQLHTAGIGLWNRSVALKSAGAVTLSLNAQMRHIASNLVLMACPLEPSESVFSKQITMATKTGRAWLDCENPTMAETSLALASECWEKLNAKFPAAAKETANLRAFFRVLCFRAEAALGLDQHDDAIGLVQQAKELLNTLESEVGYLAMLCYNFGLDVFQKGHYQHSATWLKESYEIGRGSMAVGAVKQARTLRLLANAFLEWDGVSYWQKALNAVGLANSEHCHPAGLLLKTSILLQHDANNDRLNCAFEDTLHHSELTVDMALATVRLTTQHNRGDLAFSGVQLLTKRYQNSPELSRVRLLHLELLLESGQSVEAKQLVEDCITAHNTGEPLDVKARKHLHLVLWEQAARAYEASAYVDALVWYNYSLSLFPASQEGPDKNMAKLQRNRSSCYLHLKEYEKASEAIQQARSHDPHCPQTHYLAFKLALLEEQEQDAVQALSAMCGCSDGSEDILGLICLAAQMAFERSSRELAVRALEKLVECSSNSQQIFTALRCLIRLKLTFLNSESVEKMSALHSLLSYLTRAQENLRGLQPVTVRETEAAWFLKIAWNLALQCEEHHHEMARFFSTCYELLRFSPLDSTVLLRQKTCQLMAAAACIQVARNSLQQEEKSAAFELVLKHVSECREICAQLAPAPAPASPADPTHSLLVLYEFESRLHLGHPNLEALLEQVSGLPHTEPRTFETIAALTMQGTAKAHHVGVRAAKLAIQCHLKNSQPDWERLSKCYHSLVQMVMRSEGSSDMASKEQAWTLLSEILDVLESRAKDNFPEMEILWFLAKAWNCGILLYSSLHFKEAEQWCSLGMRFLKHLQQLKPTYEEQMTAVYTEVLSRVQSHQMHTLQ